MQITNQLPCARKQGLIVQRLSGEVIVYDLDRHKAHCLNPSAALVWNYCDGKTTIAQIRQALCDEMETAASEEVVWMALEQLGKKHLLEKRIARPESKTVLSRNDRLSLRGRLSRRELARRLGLTAIAALPLITSIVAPTALASASCAPIANCGGTLAPCSTNEQCCSCICAGGSCQ